MPHESFFTNGLLNRKVELPPHADVLFRGASLNTATIDRLYFHDGIVSVNSRMPLPDAAPLTPPLEIVLGLTAIGMSEAQIALATYKSPTIIESYKSELFRRLSPDGPNRMASMVHKAFEAHVLVVEQPTPLMPRYEGLRTYIALAAQGAGHAEIERVLNPRTTARKLRQNLQLTNNASAVLYGHARGILPISGRDKFRRV